jgi:hypothetical protein
LHFRYHHRVYKASSAASGGKGSDSPLQYTRQTPLSAYSYTTDSAAPFSSVQQSQGVVITYFLVPRMISINRLIVLTMCKAAFILPLHTSHPHSPYVMSSLHQTPSSYSLAATWNPLSKLLAFLLGTLDVCARLFTRMSPWQFTCICTAIYSYSPLAFCMQIRD